MRAWCLAALVVAACGSEALRPLAIDVVGLSARAETFVLKLVPEGALTCATVGPSSVQAVEATYETRWRRAEDQARRASFPALEVERVTVVAYSEDGAGNVLQFACQELSFEDIANLPYGVLELTLTRRA